MQIHTVAEYNFKRLNTDSYNFVTNYDMPGGFRNKYCIACKTVRLLKKCVNMMQPESEGWSKNPFK